MVAESFVISIVAVVLVLFVLAVLIVACFRQKNSQNRNARPQNRIRQRRYISRTGQIVLIREMISAGAVAAIASIAACLLWAFCFLCCLKLEKVCSKCRADTSHGHSNQQEDIYNISSRVQGQGPWPTHDAHVSLDNFTITNELNKYNDDPPTYEEAMNIAASQNNNVAVPPAVVPKTTTTPTSTSASTTTN